jgi:Transcriptional regulator
MPKRFTDNEKAVIKQRLKEEARVLLNTFGVKKTTVDELVRRANIPKGTFYLFYDSKELLLFDVINEMHDVVQNRLLYELKDIRGRLTIEQITELLMTLYLEVNNSGLLKIMMSSDMELLMRKLPEEVVKEHQASDDFHMEQLFSMLSIRKDINIEAFSGAFRGIFMTMLYKREIGEEIFDDAMRLMLKGLVIQMVEENYD